MFPPEQVQLQKLNHLLDKVWAGNLFHARKWRQAGLDAGGLSSLADLASFPLTTRDELLADQMAAPPLGLNLTVPLAACKRFHRSSGTTHAPMLWADSAESWEWVLRCSLRLWQLAGAGPADRVLFPMTFGAFSGPWIIYEGACRLGCACIPSGQAETDEQLRWLASLQPAVLAGRPGVLQALALAAQTRGTSPGDFGVRKLVLTGSHSPMTRATLMQLWNAECFDRYGLTEAGSVACECTAHSGGLHLLDDEFIAETIEPATGQAMPPGEPGELVLTNLGRLARPIIRYRTGDLARLIPHTECACGLRGAMLLGGISRRAAA